MSARFSCLVAFFITLVALRVSSTRHFDFATPNDAFPPNNQGKVPSPNSLPTTQESPNEGFVGMKKIGSKPPSCEHKCYGCMPCEAIQVPTTSSHVGIQYTNYEPEGWKCKCGHTFYTP